MIAEHQVIGKIQELQNYCVANGEPTGDYTGFISTLSQAVMNYYHSSVDDLETSVQTLIGALYNDLSRRCVVYDNPIGKPYSTDYPKGYKDLTVVFDGNGTFADILAINNEAFLNGFPVTTETSTSEDGTSSSTTIVEINPIIPVWVSAITSAHEAEIAQIAAIEEFCTKGASQNMLIALFEDQGPSRRTKKVADIANEIYIDMGIKEVIEYFNLDIHVPTFL